MEKSPLLLIDTKFPHNVGAVIRAASCYGAGDVYFTGNRFNPDVMKRLPREERMKGYVKWHNLLRDKRPMDTIAEAEGKEFTPVAIELVEGSENLATFEHPENALYVFGPEDGSLPKGIRTACHRFVHIPSLHCLNLSSAAYIVLYDRMVKSVAAGHYDFPSIDGEERGYWNSPSLELLHG